MKTHSPKSLKELEELALTKGEAFKDLEGSYDTALPQEWLNAFSSWCLAWPDKSGRLPVKMESHTWYSLILSTTVWHYPEGKASGPVTCCNEVAKAHEAYLEDTE